MPDSAAQRPLRVFMASPGKSLFHRLGGGRVRLYPPGHSGPAAPELVVLPCGQLDRFNPAAIVLPPPVQARLDSGRARLVFDASSEGRPHEPERAHALHALLERLGVPARSAAYVTQDRGYARDYAAWCAAEKVGRPMAVLTYDFWIKRFFHDLEQTGPALFEARLQAFHARPCERGRRFVSLNLTPRPTKVLFLLSLLRDGLWDQGYISFGGFGLLHAHQGKSPLQLAKAMRLQPGFEALAAELTPRLPELDALGQTLLGDAAAGAGEAGGQALTEDAPLTELRDSWFSVITETEMMDRPCRITEKPFKALVNFHPIVVLGNPGALAMIRQLGFATFPGLFDEAYDEEPDPRKRFDRVYQEVVRLCGTEERELARREQVIAEALTHNARWGLTKLPAVYRDQIDAALMDQLTQALDLDRA